MASPQIGFVFSHDHEQAHEEGDLIKLLYDDFNCQLQVFLGRYGVEDLELIQILYIKIRQNPDLKLKIIQLYEAELSIVFPVYNGKVEW
jgi:hypothetical protein